MTQPFIGLTTSRILNKYGYPQHAVAEKYIQAVINAGGLPLLIPLGLSSDSLLELFPRLDGIVFTGGGDIAPQVYGGGQHPKVDDVDTDRDRIELALAQAAAEQGKPFLGICRGFQLVNVALGGTLYEDILDQHTGAQRHAWFPDMPRDHLAHSIKLEPDSRLARILNDIEVQVNSLHHQGVRQVAPPLQPTAVSPDGIVEGLELPGHPFGVAVQWHPEWLQEHASMRSLFKAFVDASRDQRVGG
jgi:putative glutamine amidotransferase